MKYYSIFLKNILKILYRTAGRAPHLVIFGPLTFSGWLRPWANGSTSKHFKNTFNMHNNNNIQIEFVLTSHGHKFCFTSHSKLVV